MLLSELGAGLRLTLVTFALCGLAYPLGMTGLGQALFPHQAQGSILRDAAGKPVGSALVGQRFEGPRWFHGRVSAIGYKAEASGASNLGPTSRALAERVAKDAAAARRAEPGAGALPVDLYTESASGLDPHVTPAAARLQAPRVAAARGLPEARVLALVAGATEGRDFGLFGEPRVNVLKLNLALEREARP